MLKVNFDEAVARLFDLYSGKGKDRLFAVMETPSEVLKEYARTHRSVEREYPPLDERVDFWLRLFEEKKEIEDDGIPCAYLSEFDEGLYAGLMGETVRFLDTVETGWVSSMAVPDYAQKGLPQLLQDLKLPDEDNFWLQRYINQLEYFQRCFDGKMGISHLIVCDAVNLLFELRGATQTFYDLEDDFESCKRVMDFSIRLCKQVQDIFFEKIPMIKGGTFSNLCGILKGIIVADSLDPYHLSGEEPFYAYGKRYIEEMFSFYDGGIVHIHANRSLF